MTGAKWYVVRTKARAEAKAVEQLRRQGLEVYLPQYRKERRHARRRDIVAAPLFPRYCFVAIDVARERWHAIRSTLGVERLIGSEDGPSAIRNEVVRELKSREDDEGFVVVERRARFSPCEKVRLTEGVFSLCSALFEGMVDRDRVAVLLNFMGRQVRVVIDGAAVAAE